MESDGRAPRFSLVLLLGLLSAPYSSQAIGGPRIPEQDLRVGVDLAPLKQIVSAMGGAMYRSDYDNNGVICGVAHTQLELQNPELKTPAFLGFMAGERGIGFRFLLNPVASVPNCAGLKVGVKCGLECCPDPTSTKWGAAGQCKFSFANVWSDQFELKMDRPWASYDLGVKLPPRRLESNGFTEMEFGILENGNWVPAKDKKSKVVVVKNAISGIGGVELNKFCGAPLTTSPNSMRREAYQEANYLALDTSVGPRLRFSEAASSDQAKQLYESTLPNLSGELVSIGISSRFFGSTAPPGDTATGLFGRMLPVRVFGARNVSGLGDITWQVVLSRASIAFGKKNGIDVIFLAFGIDNAEIAGGAIIGNPVLKSATAKAVVEMPKLAADGSLTVSMEEVVLELEFDIGTVDVPISVGDLEDEINKGLPKIGDLSKEVAIELPECIQMDSDRFRAVDTPACPPNSNGKGWVGFSRGVRGGKIVLDTAHPQFRVVNDWLQIGVKGKVELIPAR